MSKQKSTFPILALVLAATLWGINTPLIKMGVASIPPSIFMSIRFLSASLIMLPFAIYAWKPLKRKDSLLLVLASVFYISFSALALNVALTKTTASNAAVIWLLAPLLLFILSASFLKEKMSLKTFIGIMVALAGSLVIIGKPWEGSANISNELTGNLLVVISVFCNVVSTILCKPITKRVNSYQITFMTLLPGTIPVTIYAATQLHSWDMAATSTNSLIALVGSTFAVVIADFLFFYALRYKKAQSTGVYQYLETVTAITAAWFLLSEHPSTKFAAGAALVFVGIYLAEFSRSRKIHLIHLRLGR